MEFIFIRDSLSCKHTRMPIGQALLLIEDLQVVIVSFLVIHPFHGVLKSNLLWLDHQHNRSIEVLRTPLRKYPGYVNFVKISTFRYTHLR